MTATTIHTIQLDQDSIARDRIVIQVFERHLRWEARPCLVCGKAGGPECVTCLLVHDQKMRRAEDV